jgi:hypothetical protein
MRQAEAIIMVDGDDPDKTRPRSEIVRFPQRRARIAGADRPFKELGTSAFAARFGYPERQATGHWCSRCRGIWFGYLLEVTCPVCGNRHG